MDFWWFILLLVLASMISTSVSGTITTLFHIKWSICDIKMMSHMYVSIILNTIIGSTLYGFLFWMDSEAETWQGKIAPAILGASCYILSILFIDVRKYNKVRESLELLNIDSNEKLEEFIKQQEQQ